MEEYTRYMIVFMEYTWYMIVYNEEYTVHNSIHVGVHKVHDTHGT